MRQTMGYLLRFKQRPKSHRRIVKPRFPTVKFRRHTVPSKYTTHRLALTKIKPYMYESMMSYYRKRKDLPKMEQFFNQMKVDTDQRTESGFTIMIKACVEQGSVARALGYMRKMKEAGYDTTGAFSDILRYCMQHDERRAISLFQQLTNEDVPHSIFTYYIMFCLEGGDMGRAVKAYEEMKKRNIRFKADILLSVLQRPEEENLKNIFHEELRRIPLQFTLMAKRFAMQKNIPALKKIVQLAADVGFDEHFLDNLVEQQKTAAIENNKRKLYRTESQALINKLTIRNTLRRNTKKNSRVKPREKSMLIDKFGRKYSVSEGVFKTRMGIEKSKKEKREKEAEMLAQGIPLPPPPPPPPPPKYPKKKFLQEPKVHVISWIHRGYAK